MLKRILTVPLMVIGIVAVVSWTKDIIWPMIATDGLIEEGNYRDIEIGHGKLDVRSLQVDTRSRLKIAGYKGPSGETISLLDGDCQQDLLNSDTWYLIYPGLHQETLTVQFEGGRVKAIEYHREMLAP